jgi:CheY-like chemotaxis protein
MVVDDDPDFVEVVRITLQKAGHTVTTASNGEQAIKQAQRTRPDALILDVMMSYVTEGLNLARKFRAMPDMRSIPILMVSSLTGIQVSTDPTSPEHVAVDAWISKPVKPASLTEKINHLLGQESA